jgi:two-component system OmpR family response regulator
MIEKMINENVESNKFATRRLTTLVVDDEHDLADVAAELLTYHGIDAVVAYSAHEALQVMEARQDIDAIFSDVMMPSMTGLALAEVITKTYPAVKIVLTSGFTALTYWDQAPCPYRFVKKPYSIDTVIQLLRS